ncbi:RAMP superfamily CRISPR-associated protein [Campylobacter geochelonis]|uniref:RAMP superfamily n=1 Tax=Campylobacter geochelonis TaxID=1780362 RepID=A0A128EL69_9BACT|nr:RAMP superfamily CRISPR-associated protein [Campylobacter geochelonis]QKF72047.1 CRISPR/Cas system-associated RAMP protein Csm3, type III [Campylobacter geochelonis]CZE45794.1 RAMP superfamily [Campylobacter geochelonis]CZE46839.1 RAMP superfamily [Campylobacter geochelonis]CZE49866.1 RAMP superfamily [Campylobacter geochelonis]
MATLKYRVTFFDFWHLNSGVGSGALFDNTVVKDQELPYLPGKTIKGLLREICTLLDKEKSKHIFGEKDNTQAKSYFSNATLKPEQIKYLKANPSLIKYLFSHITQTRIDEKGVAVDNSLRTTEVVIPLELFGEIKCDSNDTELITKGLKSIKQIGLNRNRGLGRCQIEIVKDENDN